MFSHTLLSALTCLWLPQAQNDGSYNFEAMTSKSGLSQEISDNVLLPSVFITNVITAHITCLFCNIHSCFSIAYLFGKLPTIDTLILYCSFISILSGHKLSFEILHYVT